jgi:hypothetical protein
MDERHAQSLPSLRHRAREITITNNNKDAEGRGERGQRPTATFADIQKVLRLLEERIAKQKAQ